MSSLASDISKQIRTKAGLSQQELSERLHISRNYVALIESGAKTPSIRLLSQLERLLSEVEKGSTVEADRPYRNPGSLEASSGDFPNRTSGPVQLDPRFQPRAEPTPAMCLEHFKEFLARAEHEPGGVGFTWRLLLKHFPLDEFEPKAKPPP